MLRKLSIVLLAFLIVLSFTACPNRPSMIIPIIPGEDKPDTPVDPSKPEGPDVYPGEIKETVATWDELVAALTKGGTAEAPLHIFITEDITPSLASGKVNFTAKNVVISSEDGAKLILDGGNLTGTERTMLITGTSENVTFDFINVEVKNTSKGIEIGSGAKEITIKNSNFTSDSSATNAILIPGSATFGAINISGNTFTGFTAAIYVNKYTSAEKISISTNTFKDKGGIYLAFSLANDAEAPADIEIKGNIGDYSGESIDNTLRFNVNSIAPLGSSLKTFADKLTADNEKMTVLAIVDKTGVPIVYPAIEVTTADNLVEAMTCVHTEELQINITEDITFDTAFNVSDIHDITVKTVDDAKLILNTPMVINRANNVTLDITATAKETGIQIESTEGKGITIIDSTFAKSGDSENAIGVAVSPGNAIVTVENSSFDNFITAIYLQSVGTSVIRNNTITSYGGIYLAPNSTPIPNASTDLSAQFGNLTIENNRSDYGPNYTYSATSENDDRFDNTIRFAVADDDSSTLSDAVKKQANDIYTENPEMNVVIIHDQWHNSPVLWANGSVISE